MKDESNQIGEKYKFNPNTKFVVNFGFEQNDQINNNRREDNLKTVSVNEEPT